MCTTKFVVHLSFIQLWCTHVQWCTTTLWYTVIQLCCTPGCHTTLSYTCTTVYDNFVVHCHTTLLYTWVSYNFVVHIDVIQSHCTLLWDPSSLIFIICWHWYQSSNHLLVYISNHVNLVVLYSIAFIGLWITSQQFWIKWFNDWNAIIAAPILI